ncbi:alpha/beta-hydrolase [Multifurca ochricompacta]|uniref:Alpha/beta-hydrolase n=1 Tax=Multifurca ochricompacta TaxID=376703 RepID=A0AAD4QMZ0_9AGAM|nr:alpha/beta-hydrolase [Multifurca ochricompacta]
MAEVTPTTIAYKQVGELTLYIDVYPPPTGTTSYRPVPAVVFFHGGGMTVGDRSSWLPIWLCRRTTATGLAFISADYRLMPPGTGHDVLEDVVDLFAYLAKTPLLGTTPIDGTRLAVAGSSAGGMCAFLAAVHAKPKPLAVLSIYGLGGDVFSPHLLAPKNEPFFLGRELLDPAEYSAFLYPATTTLPPIAQSKPTFFGRESAKAGLPSNPRHVLAQLWLQFGTYLDYWTGLHEPSISETLRELLPTKDEDEDTEISTKDARFFNALPVSERAIFPQLWVTPEWPPVFLIHGSEDTAVLTDSSRVIHSRLLDAGVKSTLHILDGFDHSFDLKRSAEETFEKLGQTLGFVYL